MLTREKSSLGPIGTWGYSAMNPDGSLVNGSKTYYQPIVQKTKNWLVDSVANHSWRRRVERNEMVGSIFTTRYWEYSGTPAIREIWRGGPLGEYYSGPLSAMGSPDQDFNVLVPHPGTDAQGLGPSFYQEMLPTKPSWSGLNALIELRDFPRMLRQRLESLKDIFDHNLAVQFGWVPLLSDIRSMVRTQIDMQKKLNWLIAHEGKPVRRRTKVRHLETVTNNSVAYQGYWCLHPGNLTLQFYRDVPRMWLTTKEITEYWASARFLFVLPPGPKDIVWKSRMIGLLNGLDVTPGVIWNALPWSWLVDWFSNAGDVAANLSVGVADKCVADQFYIMAHRWYDERRDAEGYFYDRGNHPITVNASLSFRRGIKTRQLGNAFGIALTEANLNPKQLAILGSLGMSRAL